MSLSPSSKAKSEEYADQQIVSIASVDPMDLNVVDIRNAQHDLNVVGIRDDLIIADGEKDVSSTAVELLHALSKVN